MKTKVVTKWKKLIQFLHPGTPQLIQRRTDSYWDFMPFQSYPKSPSNRFDSSSSWQNFMIRFSCSLTVNFCVSVKAPQGSSRGRAQESPKSMKEIGWCHFICILPVFLLAFIHESSIIWREMCTSISVTLESGFVSERTPVWNLFIEELCRYICFKQYSDSETKTMTVKNNCTQGLSAVFQRPF